MKHSLHWYFKHYYKDVTPDSDLYRQLLNAFHRGHSLGYRKSQKDQQKLQDKKDGIK